LRFGSLPTITSSNDGSARAIAAVYAANSACAVASSGVVADPGW